MGTVSKLPLVARLGDGYSNLVSRLGSAADRNVQSAYWIPVISQQQIEAAYRSSWLTRKVHDLVPFEMTRAGRLWQADKEQIEVLEAAEKRLALWSKVRAALTTARLHGGAALVLGVRQGMPEQPLNVATLGKDTLRYAVVASRFQLHAPFGMDLDPESDFYMQPEMWEMRGAKGNTVRIHPSRVIPFHGRPVPAGAVTMSQIDQFWGDPLLLSIKSAIDNAEMSQAAVATLMHEMKQDVIKIPGLTEQIATEGAENRLAARIEAINRFKSMFNALLLDAGNDDGKGGEEWETRQLSFAQHPELLRQFVAIVGGAADIPVTRLMGESPGGLQSTGKGEQDDMNRMVAAMREADLAPALLRLDEILIRSALGNRPPEIGYNFAPLEDPDEQQESENEKRNAEAMEIIDRMGLIPKDAFAKAVANRLNESGRWPGLDQAIEESAEELGADPHDDGMDPPNLPDPANDDPEAAVDELERRRAITRDQAIALLSDARPRSLYVRRNLLNAAEFIAWAKSQGFETTTPADDLHVTIAFSRAHVDWLKVGEAWDYRGEEGRLSVSPGGARIVEALGDKGAVVLLFTSSTLSYRHEEIRRAGASWGFTDYQPHVTITYKKPDGLDLSKVEPFRGALEFGPEIFEEVVENWETTRREE